MLRYNQAYSIFHAHVLYNLITWVLKFDKFCSYIFVSDAKMFKQTYTRDDFYTYTNINLIFNYLPQLKI